MISDKLTKKHSVVRPTLENMKASFQLSEHMTLVLFIWFLLNLYNCSHRGFAFQFMIKKINCQMVPGLQFPNSFIYYLCYHR